MTSRTRNLLGAIFFSIMAIFLGSIPHLGVPIKQVTWFGITFSGAIISDTFAFLAFLIALLQIYAFKYDWSLHDVEFYMARGFIIIFSVTSGILLLFYFIGISPFKFFEIPWWNITIIILWIHHVSHIKKFC